MEFEKLSKTLKEYLIEEQRQHETQKDAPPGRSSKKAGLSATQVELLYLKNPPEDFKTLKVTPQKHELRSEENPFLRPNIIKGKYPSSDVYLDVQFRLLREDFMNPLRSGIHEYLKYRYIF